MPIYEYECRECGYRFEVRQGFDDERLTDCQRDGCQGSVHRVFSPPAIIFKGSGFYTTDYGRGKDKRESATAERPSEKSDSPSKVAKTESD